MKGFPVAAGLLTQDGVQQQVAARYTFVYEWIDGQWLIVNHHSSTLPES